MPRLILHAFGSEVNGLVSSITQFLSIISFLELGVGAVVQSALYKPLSDKDDKGVSKIMASAQKFFSKLAIILLFYIVILIFIYPYISNQDFGWLYTTVLIIAIGINSFSQYYFGVVDRLLLTADQRGYIQYNAQTCTLIANTIACALLIEAGASIHIVKLTTSLIYLVRPYFLRQYVNKNYNINRKISYIGEPIKQKWNGAAQHIAAVILSSTDSIVLTMFSSLSNVSIYSVYYSVVNGINLLISSLTSGVQALLGELLARKEELQLQKVFGWTEWSIHTATTLIFTCTAILIVPFVSVYTAGVTDANYIQPIFAFLIVLANAGHCLRLPYNIVILAGGHYKQTQRCYVVAAVLNIVISIATVHYWGLIGVAIGTLIAMIYQTFWMALYNSNHLINWPFIKVLKQIVVDIITVIIFVSVINVPILTSFFEMKIIGYSSWIVLAIKVFITGCLCSIFINLLFYRKYVFRIFDGAKTLCGKFLDGNYKK